MSPASEFSKDRYRQDVLEAALKAGDVLPPDLMTRYAVSDAIAGNAAAFNARVAEVVRYWRVLQQQIVYESLAVALLAAHDRLKDAGELSYASFARQRTAGRNEALAGLEAKIKDIAASTPAVLRSTVSLLHRDCHGLVSEDTIVSQLSSHQVIVVDHPWVLPPRPSKLSGLAARLDTLDLRLAAETVFGTSVVRAGFRLRQGFQLSTGKRITSTLLAAKKKELAQRRPDDRKTAHEEILQVLQQCADRGELDALLLWQLIEVLQPQVTEGLPNRSVISLASSLGLDEAEAAELVLTLTQQRSGDRGTSARELERQVNEAEQAGDTEEAAALLAQLIAAHGDGDGSLESRLQALPPPPLPHVLATSQGDTVRVEWPPAPTRVGNVRYRVVRCSGEPARSPSAGLTVAETIGLSAADREPPNGVRLYYTVFATRGADVWSAGTSAAELLRLPEVTDFRFEAQPDAIAGWWRVPPGATEVVVTRATAAPPGPGGGHLVPASLTDFHDTSLQGGTRYYYRVRAVYVNEAGESWPTPGVVHWATPDTPLDTVLELRAELQPAGDPGIALTWCTVEAGTARIYRSNGPPALSAGASIGLDEMARFGHPAPGRVISRTNGESCLSTQVFNGRSCFTAITVGAARAVVGASATVAVMSPVTDVRARRDGDHLWLRWNWADDCHVCRVEWSAGPDRPQAASPVECGRQRYHDDGGFGIRVGPGPVTVSIRSVYRDATGEILSTPFELPIPGRDIVVRYAFRRRTRWAPWRRDRLVLRADRACQLPSLTVVHRTGRIMPLRPEQGEPVCSLPEVRLPQGRRLSVPIPTLRLARPGRLACFFAGEPPDSISLVPDRSRR
jgi:hypothetical protein